MLALLSSCSRNLCSLTNSYKAACLRQAYNLSTAATTAGATTETAGAVPEPDKLYKKLEIEVRGNEPAVLNSYQWYALESARLLGVALVKTTIPPRHYLRRTLLKSRFVHSKHRVQYEIRTHFRIWEFRHVTGSTADTYLEYIQRNLPEGVAMKVTRHELQRLPEHVAEPPGASSSSSTTSGDESSSESSDDEKNK